MTTVRCPPTRSAGIAALAERVSSRTGLDLYGCHRERMHDVLAATSRAAGATTIEEHIELLDHPAVYASLVPRLTVGESYFFRDPTQLALISSILASWQHRERTYRAWSAGCSTGEEPYTIAIMLDRAGLLDRTRILATDISPAAVDATRAAVYGAWALRRCDDRARAAYFEPAADNFRLHQRYVEAVDARCRNLLEGPPAAGAFDLVLCRNVLMYLHDDAVDMAASVLRDALVPDGWLLTGPADPVLRCDGLRAVRGPYGLAYQRSASGGWAAAGSTAGPGSRAAAPVGPKASPVRRRHLRPHPTRPASGSGQVAGPGARDRAPSARSGPSDATPELVPSLLDSTRWIEDALDHLEAGRGGAAAEAARAAVYLEPGLVAGHLALAHAHELEGRDEQARRCFLTALDLLTTMAPTLEVPLTGGERAGSLATTVARLAGG